MKGFCTEIKIGLKCLKLVFEPRLILVLNKKLAFLENLRAITANLLTKKG
jgi:hypothetical protein